MALEESKSHLAAMRNEYALLIEYVNHNDIPDNIFEFFNPEYFIETRKLYENRKEKRTQWIFKDPDGNTRLIAAFTDTGELEGFIEIFDENFLITTEYNYSDKGGTTKTDYKYNDKAVVSAVAYEWIEKEIKEEIPAAVTETQADTAETEEIAEEKEEQEEKEKFRIIKISEYEEIYIDYYRYNRSASLRAVERVYSRDQKISDKDNMVRISFPGNVMAAASEDFFLGERLNEYPEYFGDLFVKKNSRMVYTTDSRGKILTQTLYTDNEEDEEETVIWSIKNTWAGERIVSIQKTEGEEILLAQYEYDSKQKRILEKNYKNGVLERVVRTEGKRDIEELYMNDVVVLRAVWEDGRKISETRVSTRNRSN
jgi:hypothetical protein